MKKVYGLMAAILCAAVVLSGCGKTTPVSNEGEIIEETFPVEITPTGQSLIENEYMYSGTIKAAEEIAVPTLLGGKVVSANFEVGDRVNAGDVLFTMDTTDIQNNINTLIASVEAAQASVNSAQTNLELVNGAAMETQIENAKTAISNAELNLSNVEVNLNKAKLDFKNNKELYENGIIAKEAYIQYENGYKQVKIAYEQAQVAHQQALTNYDITANKMPSENKKKAQDGLALAQASKKSAVAQLESARNKLKDATITSPISGVVSESNVKKGEFIAMGAVVPMTIMDTSRVNIEVGVSEQVINKVKKGDTTKVLVSSVSPEFVQGKVISIEPAAKQDNTYGIKIEIDNQAGLLKPGMFGEVYFSSEKSENAIVVLRSAVLEDQDGFYVLIEEEGIARRVPVTIGIENEENVEITSGLLENMNLVTLGQNYIEDGDKLIITSNGKEE